MKLTLEQAISHCYDVANGQTEQGKCTECAQEHLQLANWLEELVKLKSQHELQAFVALNHLDSMVEAWYRRPNTSLSFDVFEEFKDLIQKEKNRLGGDSEC